MFSGESAYDKLSIYGGDGTGSYNFSSIKLETNNFGGERGLTIESHNPHNGTIAIDDLYTVHILVR